MLTTWRRDNGMRQADLASLLGVSQGTISKWEAGADMPHPSKLQDITSLLQQQREVDPFAVDKIFVCLQRDVRALFSHEDARLMAVSEGLRAIWPSFATLVGVPMRSHLIGETRLIYEDAQLAARIRMREIAVIIGVSDRHVSLSPDEPVKHRWVLAFRHRGSQTAAEIVYEPCDPLAPVGIQRIIALSEGRQGHDLPSPASSALAPHKAGRTAACRG